MQLRRHHRAVRLGEELASAGLITQQQLQEALARHRQTGKRIGHVLIEMGVVTARDVAQVLSRQCGVPYIDLSNYILDPKIVALVSEDFARRYQVLPINKVGNRLTVAMVDPVNVLVQDDLLKLWEEARKTVIFITHSLDEAVVLGDRVAVMSRRPGRIKAMFDVRLPRPRNALELRNNPEFIEVRRQVWEALREEVLRSREEG